MEGGDVIKMPQPFPDPNITSAESLFEYTYDITNGLTTMLFLAACSIVIFLLLQSKGYKSSDSMALAGLFTLVLGRFLWILGLLQGHIMVLFVVLTLGASIWSIFDR